LQNFPGGEKNAERMTDLNQDATKLFEALLADPEGRKIFQRAVESAFLLWHGSVGGPYNIDNMGYLAAAIECHQYAEAKMSGKPRFRDRFELLTHAVQNISVSGPILEFGVNTGATINHIADMAPGRKVYGFDSFKGLPEEWTWAKKGQFARESPPVVRENVELIVGWFERTLLPFLDTHEFEQIALLHIDCDLYSATQTIFAQLHGKIGPNTIIVFDEYWNYPSWKKYEYRAFQEYVEHRGRLYEYIGLAPAWFHVAVRILT
jgi:hypothetical protein